MGWGSSWQLGNGCKKKKNTQLTFTIREIRVREHQLEIGPGQVEDNPSSTPSPFPLHLLPHPTHLENFSQ